jgi:CubicO group peptidase (beta-lactamase class C family)
MPKALTRPAATFAALLVLLLFVYASRTAPADAQAIEKLDGFDAYVERVMAEWKIPGLAVGIIKEGKVVLAKGYGHRDVDKKLPVTPQTLMAIGSNSKSFTVTLMGMLSDEGRLDWDKPVRTYLPDFELHDEVSARLMTPTDLVTHRSGLPRHDQVWLPATLSRKELYARLRHLEPSATFRQRYQYNNLMFMTAGHLVERVTNESWDDLVRQRIFTPLGMIRSNTSVREMPKSDDYALPHVEREGKITAVPFRNIDAVGPAGSINSSIDDMLRYVQMHIDQGTAGSKAILSKRFAARMQSLHSAAPVTIDLDAPVYTEMGAGGYGLGVSVRSYRGHKLVDHGGGIDGFISAMSWMPHDRLGVVVLTNLSGINPAPNIVTLNAYDRLLGLDPVDYVARSKAAQERNQRQGAEREKKREAERTDGTSPSRPLAQFAGTYEHPAYGTVTIAENESRLSLTRGRETTLLEHFHYDVFRAVATVDTREWTARPRMTFTAGASGRVESIAIPLEPTVADIVFKRRAATTGTF